MVRELSQNDLGRTAPWTLHMVAAEQDVATLGQRGAAKPTSERLNPASGSSSHSGI
jgi:hypothetical protein